jgi:DNA-binding transcriptional regulator YiaG
LPPSPTPPTTGSTPLSPAEVRAAREALGMTKDELAAVMGCGLRAVQTWESGERNCPGPAVLALRLLMALPPSRRALLARQPTG